MYNDIGLIIKKSLAKRALLCCCVEGLSVKVDPCAKVRCSHALARCMVVNGTAKCQCPFVMTLEYFPVCGSDGVTYPNPSSLDIASCNSGGAIKKVKDGKCKLSFCQFFAIVTDVHIVSHNSRMIECC